MKSIESLSIKREILQDAVDLLDRFSEEKYLFLRICSDGIALLDCDTPTVYFRYRIAFDAVSRLDHQLFVVKSKTVRSILEKNTSENIEFLFVEDRKKNIDLYCLIDGEHKKASCCAQLNSVDRSSVFKFSADNLLEFLNYQGKYKENEYFSAFINYDTISFHLESEYLLLNLRLKMKNSFNEVFSKYMIDSSMLRSALSSSKGEIDFILEDGLFIHRDGRLIRISV